MKHEKELEEFTGTTLLNCCILLSKVDNTADSLKYAKQAKESFEKELKIKQGKKMPQFKGESKNPEEAEEVQKKLSSYAIALHMIAKSLKGIGKFDEGKEFLNRSLHVAENLLPNSNPRLVETIKADIDDFNKQIRGLPSKRVIEDPDKLLEKLENLMANKSPHERQLPEELKRNMTQSPSDK